MEWTADALPDGRMDDALISGLLDECARHRDQVKSIEPYLNNEPFLDPRFLDVLRGIRDRLRCNIEVSTNASVFDGDLVQAVLDERLIDDLRISIFGATKATYETIMVKMRWERVLANVERYRQRWVELGRPNRTRIVFVHNPQLHPPDEVERVRELWAQSGFELIIWEQLDRAGNNRTLLHQLRRGQIVGCKGGYMRDRVVIMFNGDVLLCCQDWARQVVIGRVGQRSLEEVWNSPERRRAAAAIYASSGTAPDLCSRCEMAMVV
jgi:radical SAM protein with 4Fe4S-binding SPASM domain